MSGGAKTALIIGGAAAGVFVLLKVFAPKPAAPKSTGFNLTSILGTGGLGSLGKGLAGLFKGSGSSSGSSSFIGTGDNEAAVKASDAANIAGYDAQGTTDAPVFGVAGLDY